MTKWAFFFYLGYNGYSAELGNSGCYKPNKLKTNIILTVRLSSFQADCVTMVCIADESAVSVAGILLSDDPLDSVAIRSIRPTSAILSPVVTTSWRSIYKDIKREEKPVRANENTECHFYLSKHGI